MDVSLSTVETHPRRRGFSLESFEPLFLDFMTELCELHDDPFCKTRAPDDRGNALDHFFVKLFRLPERLHTVAAKRQAEQRIATMKIFLSELQREISS